MGIFDRIGRVFKKGASSVGSVFKKAGGAIGSFVKHDLAPELTPFIPVAGAGVGSMIGSAIGGGLAALSGQEELVPFARKGGAVIGSIIGRVAGQKVKERVDKELKPKPSRPILGGDPSTYTPKNLPQREVKTIGGMSIPIKKTQGVSGPPRLPSPKDDDNRPRNPLEKARMMKKKREELFV